MQMICVHRLIVCKRSRWTQNHLHARLVWNTCLVHMASALDFPWLGRPSKWKIVVTDKVFASQSRSIPTEVERMIFASACIDLKRNTDSLARNLFHAPVHTSCHVETRIPENKLYCE